VKKGLQIRRARADLKGNESIYKSGEQSRTGDETLQTIKKSLDRRNQAGYCLSNHSCQRREFERGKKHI